MNKKDLKEEVAAWIDENVAEEAGEVDLDAVAADLEEFVGNLDDDVPEEPETSTK